jgi:hypothetical protein
MGLALASQIFISLWEMWIRSNECSALLRIQHGRKAIERFQLAIWSAFDMDHCGPVSHMPFFACLKADLGSHRGPAHNHHQSLVCLSSSSERLATHHFTGTVSKEDKRIPDRG